MQYRPLSSADLIMPQRTVERLRRQRHAAASGMQRRLPAFAENADLVGVSLQLLERVEGGLLLF